MGREARCTARWSGGEGEVKALLETHELVLRGALKASWPLTALAGANADGEWLRLPVDDDRVMLRLGATDAASWARKIATPPPKLADKLGVGPHARVLVIGEVEDPVLEEALAPALAPTAGLAHLSLAVVESPADLEQALAAHGEQMLPDAPIWIVNVKGKTSPFGENAIRGDMRALGYVDSKTASVSATLAATRYTKRKA